MKITVCLVLLTVMQLNASVFSQVSKVTLNMKGQSIENAFKELRKQTKLDFFYSHKELDVNKKVDISVDKVSLEEALIKLVGKKYFFEYYDNIVVIRPSVKNAVQQKGSVIKGVVKDEKGFAIPGVTVVVKGTTLGVSTDVEGKFKLEVPKKENIVLEFSFVGMKNKLVHYKGQKDLNIVMENDTKQMDEVVVTGFFERDKNTFTGAAKAITSKELLEVSQTSILEAISILEPSVQLMQSNEMGSNPNHIPEIIIRGTTSLATDGEVGLNRPLIILDGVEITLEELYDLDIYDIDRLDILKDASATAIYGERGANGVIVIARKTIKDPKLKLRYTIVPTFEFPETEGYNLCDATQKLELERIAGLYDDPTGNDLLEEEYYRKYTRIAQGVNTDWLAIPLQNSFGQSHSATLSGRNKNLSYSASARYSDKRGVMKEDYRKNGGFGVFFSYSKSQKLIVSFRANYTQNENSPSKYGAFSSYASMNPYDQPYDEYGVLIKKLSFNLNNPLYEASLSSFKEKKSTKVSSSLDIRWNLSRNFFIKANGNVSKTTSRSDRFISPKSNVFNGTIDSEKGSYSISNGENLNYATKITANYHKALDDRGTVLTLNTGLEIEKSEISSYSSQVIGIHKDFLDYYGFASLYGNGTPSGNFNMTTRAGGFVALNFAALNKYFVDGLYRISGSSKFGANTKYAPFWSVGMGWNIHNEEIFKAEWLNIMRLRASYGHNGSVNFPANQAITTYKYLPELAYAGGIGTVPMAMGNPELTWQLTKNTNIGFSSSLLGNRLDVNIDWYKQETEDMLINISLPPSSGVSNVKDNMGSQSTTGYEFSLSGVILKNKDMAWRLSLNGAHNETKILKISDALKRQNDELKGKVASQPRILLEEGQSPTSIHAVRSLGIDPASGKEIFLTKDNQRTFIYNPDDKVVVGNSNPDLRGGIRSTFSYKNISLNVSCSYSFGGDIYNSTRAQKIENIDPQKNVDARAFEERWKKPGDISPYLSLVDEAMGQMGHTSRFVERENKLDISSIGVKYNFKANLLKKLNIKKLAIGLNVNNITQFSTVRRERGTSYPFSRSFNFTISPTF